MTGRGRPHTIATVGLAVLLATPWATATRAGAIAEKATEAERLLADGDPAAFSVFDQAVDRFWEAAPLQFSAATFADWITGYGKYQPRGERPFGPSETALIYVEPVAYGFAEQNDTVAISLAADLEIRSSGGLILAKADDFATLAWQGRSRNRAFHAAISLGLPELAAGDYALLLTLRDQTSGKSATATLPFTTGE